MNKLHQLWGGVGVIDSDYLNYIETAKQINVGWTHKLWSDTEAYNDTKQLIEKYNIPFDDYPYDIERWDILRLLILYKHGGVCCDLDMEFTDNLNQLNMDNDCGFITEKHIRRGGADSLHQSFIYSKPGCSFLGHILKNTRRQLKLAEKLNLPKREHVSCCIGPDSLTTAYYMYPYKNKVHVMHEDIVYTIMIHHKLNKW